MIFSSDDRVLIKLLRQNCIKTKKEYGAENLSQNFQTSRGHRQDQTNGC